MDKLNDGLLNLGFDYQGDFDPIEFNANDFNTCEIGAFIVATRKGYTVFLDYSDMTYWDIDNDSIAVIFDAINIIVSFVIKKNNDN